jgi:hypothetical protein
MCGGREGPSRHPRSRAAERSGPPLSVSFSLSLVFSEVSLSEPEDDDRDVVIGAPVVGLLADALGGRLGVVDIAHHRHSLLRVVN